MKIDLTKITPEDLTYLLKNDEKAWADAIAAVNPKIDFDLWQLTIKDLGDFINKKTPDVLLKIMEKDNQTANEFLQKQKAIEVFFEKYTKLLEMFSIPGTKEDVNASKNLPKFNETEGLLIFIRQYFGLKSFTEAENVTLSDLFLARKDNFITIMFQRNLLNNKKITNNKKGKKNGAA